MRTRVQDAAAADCSLRFTPKRLAGAVALQLAVLRLQHAAQLQLQSAVQLQLQHAAQLQLQSAVQLQLQHQAAVVQLLLLAAVAQHQLQRQAAVAQQHLHAVVALPFRLQWNPTFLHRW